MNRKFKFDAWFFATTVLAIITVVIVSVGSYNRAQRKKILSTSAKTIGEISFCLSVENVLDVPLCTKINRSNGGEWWYGYVLPDLSIYGMDCGGWYYPSQMRPRATRLISPEQRKPGDWCVVTNRINSQTDLNIGESNDTTTAQ